MIACSNNFSSDAELICHDCRLMPESVLATPKEKKLSGRQWFESGRMVFFCPYCLYLDALNRHFLCYKFKAYNLLHVTKIYVEHWINLLVKNFLLCLQNETLTIEMIIRNVVSLVSHKIIKISTITPSSLVKMCPSFWIR